jgi:hypothetical protein
MFDQGRSGRPKGIRARRRSSHGRIVGGGERRAQSPGIGFANQVRSPPIGIFQPRLKSGAALSKVPCGGMLSTTPHQSQANVCRGACAPKLGLVRLNRMANPQNGQWGCGESKSMQPIGRPRWLTESKRDRSEPGVLIEPAGSLRLENVS